MARMNRSPSLVEVITVVAVVVLLAVTAVSIISDENFAIAVVGIVAAAFLIFLLVRINISTDRLRARQSERTLRLAAQTLPYMQKGLTLESAQEVCKLLLPATGATAVAITDREKILGYFGREMDTHPVGAAIRTAATRRTIETGEIQVARSFEQIGDNIIYESLQAGICVPLKQHDEVIGVLKFYYKSPRQLDANQQAMAEGLGGLLEMQLSLAELEYQRELAVKMNLKALQAQINPHFLYNTINTIAALIRTDPQQARILLREFAIFYRQTLESSMENTILDREITQTLRYLGFEKARFGSDQIIGTVFVEDDLHNITVPAFIIQPLVENAVAHGRREEEPLHITIDAKVVSGQVVVVVEDDGVGMAESTHERALTNEDQHHTSVALKNVAERLEGFFGINAGLAVQSELGVGTRVILNLGPKDSCKVVKDDQSNNS
ncbi:MAG: histidine kinase [Coriobacteriales bacterium]|nr:histidine kinase [Coriobacteriales bacterium]